MESVLWKRCCGIAVFGPCVVKPFCCEVFVRGIFCCGICGVGSFVVESLSWTLLSWTCSCGVLVVETCVVDPVL